MVRAYVHPVRAAAGDRSLRKPRPIPGQAPTGSRRHGLSMDIISGMAAKQGGRCAICRGPLPLTPIVDHDHALAATHPHRTERGCSRCVRGLLCDSDNLLLGFAKDDPRILLSAVAYLRAWSEKLGR